MKLPGPDTAVAAAGGRHARRRPAGDAHLRQRRGARVPPHHRGRRQVPVHHQGRGCEQGRRAVTLYPYALISRHGTPHTLGYYILHEGMIGVFGDKGCRRRPTPTSRRRRRSPSHPPMPGSASPTNTGRRRCSRPHARRSMRQFSSGQIGNQDLPGRLHLDPRHHRAGATSAADTPAVRRRQGSLDRRRLQQQLGLNQFDLLIDWGWFYFITKPMFLAMDWIYHLVGNFGVAILIITVLVKTSSSRSPTSPTPRWRR